MRRCACLSRLRRVPPLCLQLPASLRLQGGRVGGIAFDAAHHRHSHHHLHTPARVGAPLPGRSGLQQYPLTPSGLPPSSIKRSSSSSSSGSSPSFTPPAPRPSSSPHDTSATHNVLRSSKSASRSPPSGVKTISCTRHAPTLTRCHVQASCTVLPLPTPLCATTTAATIVRVKGRGTRPRILHPTPVCRRRGQGTRRSALKLTANRIITVRTAVGAMCLCLLRRGPPPPPSRVCGGPACS